MNYGIVLKIAENLLRYSQIMREKNCNEEMQNRIEASTNISQNRRL